MDEAPSEVFTYLSNDKYLVPKFVINFFHMFCKVFFHFYSQYELQFCQNYIHMNIIQPYKVYSTSIMVAAFFFLLSFKGKQSMEKEFIMQVCICNYCGVLVLASKPLNSLHHRISVGPCPQTQSQTELRN